MCKGASSLVSQVPSLRRGRCLGISRNISDRVLSSQMLSWDDFYHFCRHPLTFLTICSVWDPPCSCPMERIIFSNHRTKWSLSSTLNPPQHPCPRFLLQCCILPGNSTTQQPCRGPRLLNSGSEVLFSVLVLLARSAGREGETLSQGSIIITFPVTKSMPSKSIFSSRQDKSIAICKESHCD